MYIYNNELRHDLFELTGDGQVCKLADFARVWSTIKTATINPGDNRSGKIHYCDGPRRWDKGRQRERPLLFRTRRWDIPRCWKIFQKFNLKKPFVFVLRAKIKFGGMKNSQIRYRKTNLIHLRKFFFFVHSFLSFLFFFFANKNNCDKIRETFVLRIKFLFEINETRNVSYITGSRRCFTVAFFSRIAYAWREVPQAILTLGITALWSQLGFIKPLRWWVSSPTVFTSPLRTQSQCSYLHYFPTLQCPLTRLSYFPIRQIHFFNSPSGNRKRGSPTFFSNSLRGGESAKFPKDADETGRRLVHVDVSRLRDGGDGDTPRTAPSSSGFFFFFPSSPWHGPCRFSRRPGVNVTVNVNLIDSSSASVVSLQAQNLSLENIKQKQKQKKQKQKSERKHKVNSRFEFTESDNLCEKRRIDGSSKGE